MNSQAIGYFPLNTDFFDDDKIALIEAEFGLKGSVIALRLLCKIYGTNGYYYQWGADECLLFAKSMGTGIAPKAVDEVVKGLVRRSFFDKELFDSYQVLTSRGIQARYFEVVKRRQQVVIRHDILLADVSNLPNVNISDENVNISMQNVDIFPQSKVKESKVKKIKPSSSFSSSPSMDGRGPSLDGKQEQEIYFEIMFWRNVKDPGRETERFLNWNTAHNWTMQSGERFDTADRRAALARMWEPKEQGTRTGGAFLEAWRGLHERVKAKNPTLARQMVDMRAAGSCINGSVVYTVPKALPEYLAENRSDAEPLMRYAKGLPVKFMTYG